MAPADSDVVVVGKRSLSAFPNTTLEQQLKAHGIESIALAGFMANCCVLHAAKLQKCIVLSSCEAELVALSAATCDAMWLRNYLSELGFPPAGPTPIHCDNAATRAVAGSPVAEKHLKHVARRHFFVQDAVKAGEIVVPPIASEKNIADVLTKIEPSPLPA